MGNNKIVRNIEFYRRKDVALMEETAILRIEWLDTADLEALKGKTGTCMAKTDYIVFPLPFICSLRDALNREMEALPPSWTDGAPTLEKWCADNGVSLDAGE